MDNKQAILGFTEFFKGITGNQDLEIPSEIAEKCGIQADGDIITALCSLPKIQSSDGQDYVQLADVLETVRRYKPSVAIPSAEPKTEQFAKWVATEIFDEWEYNKDSFAEIACRKLAKLGIVRAKGDEWELVEPQERSE